MVDDTTSSTEEPAVDDGTVILVSPEGVEVEASHPVTINDLVYGKGYRLKGNDDPEAAVKAAVPEAAQKSETAEHTDATGTQTEVTAVPPSGVATAKTVSKSSGKPAGAPSTT